MTSFDEEYMCPVCGYAGLYEPPYDTYGCPSYEICPCCGVEYGYHDARISHELLRRKWLADGAKWFSGVTLPSPEWSASVQLEKAGIE